MHFKLITYYYMNVLIINGSPKGAGSITLQTCLYIQKHFPEHHYEVLHVGQKIAQFERDFGEAAEALRRADLLLFAYPVYTFLAPSQLHRFVELMKEHISVGVLNIEGKCATQITTSKHFYDVTAHRYIEDNGKDMGLRLFPGLSADMDDLLSEKGRGEALGFFQYVLFQIGGMPETDSISEKTIAVVADLAPEDASLKTMVDTFTSYLKCKYKLININDFPFKGGCISCFNCSGDGKCIYSDGFDTFLREEIQTCDAIVYAFTIKDHSMGSRFKMYDDRQFCNGHRTVTMGAPTGYLINGDYAHEPNLQMVVEGRANVGGNYLCGVATSEEVCDAEHRIMGIKELASCLGYALAHKYQQPANFFGVGGMKIFRDLIYQMRGLMRADHKFFKSHGQYDFPQKKWGTSMKMYLVGWLMNNKKLRRKVGGEMTTGMLKPYREAMKK